MPTNNGQYDYQLVFPPLFPDTLPTPSPHSCLLPSFSGLPMYAPVLKLTAEEIAKSVSGISNGVYIVLLWISSRNLLVPVYIGSGDVRKRLLSHLKATKNANLNTDSHYSSKEYNINPKWFYELLTVTEAQYFMFTWFECPEHRSYENETYHVLVETPYLLNARAVIRDERSKLKYRNKKAQENFYFVRELLR